MSRCQRRHRAAAESCWAKSCKVFKVNASTSNRLKNLVIPLLTLQKGQSGDCYDLASSFLQGADTRFGLMWTTWWLRHRMAQGSWLLVICVRHAPAWPLGFSDHPRGFPSHYLNRFQLLLSEACPPCFLPGSVRSEGEGDNRSGNGWGVGCGSHRSTRCICTLDDLSDLGKGDQLGWEHRSDIIASDNARAFEARIAILLLIYCASEHLAIPLICIRCALLTIRVVQILVAWRDLAWACSICQIIVIASAILLVIIARSGFPLRHISPSCLQCVEIAGWKSEG